MLLLLTTVSSQADAQQLAQTLIQQRLAACVQMSEIHSVYEWQGHVERSGEWRLLIKTMPQRRSELETVLKQSHPYELPAMVWLEAQGSEEFERWIQEQTQAIASDADS